MLAATQTIKHAKYREDQNKLLSLDNTFKTINIKKKRDDEDYRFNSTTSKTPVTRNAWTSFGTY